jgi:hypothetical protein
MAAAVPVPAGRDAAPRQGSLPRRVGRRGHFLTRHFRRLGDLLEPFRPIAGAVARRHLAGQRLKRRRQRVGAPGERLLFRAARVLSICSTD